MSPVAATWPEGPAAGRNEAFPSVCGRSSGWCGVCLVCGEGAPRAFSPRAACASRERARDPVCSGTGRLRELALVLFGNRKASRIGSRFVREPEGFENWLSFYSRTGIVGRFSSVQGLWGGVWKAIGRNCHARWAAGRVVGALLADGNRRSAAENSWASTWGTVSLNAFRSVSQWGTKT